MTERQNLHLSKSRFTAGRQCLKRLYLEYYHPAWADPVDDNTQARFDTGNAVGELARQRFPGGRLIDEPYNQHLQAMETTQSLLSQGAVPALYEAAFAHEGIRIRADVLHQAGPGYDLAEVKSSTSVKPEHISDVAIQLYVLESSGIPVNRAYLMHLNNQYVYPGGDYDLEQLFALGDVTDEARRFVADEVPDDLARMREVLAEDAPPDIETGSHCTKPYTCPFFGYCHGEPAAADTDPALASFGPNLASVLAEVRYPASFLDFETFMPALPRYPGTRPYQTIPFQWSLHVQDAGGGRLYHREFLNEDGADPRERVILSLLDAMPAAGSIVAYSGYEKRMLNELATAFPQYANGLLPLVDRLYDLLPVVRRHYSHPSMPNNSLKTVLPFLVPGAGYDDLDISEGTLASLHYLRMIDPDTPDEEGAKIRQDLLAYCARDTEATVRVLAALKAGAGR